MLVERSSPTVYRCLLSNGRPRPFSAAQCRTVVPDRLTLLNVEQVVPDRFPSISQVLLPSPRFGERGWG